MYEWDFLIVFGVIVLGVLIYAGNKKRKREKNTRAMDILNQRYAKGEITEQEYIKRKETMKPKDKERQ